jgi:prepilin-type processing-associated H-X9-DG protein
MVGLSKAILVYTNDNDGMFPSATNWCDLLVEHAYVTEKALMCRASFWPVPSYGFNKNLDGLRLDDVPPDTVVLFEIEGGWNASGGPELVAENKHRGGSNFVFADGTMSLEKEGSASKLRWKVEQDEKEPNTQL